MKETNHPYQPCVLALVVRALGAQAGWFRLEGSRRRVKSSSMSRFTMHVSETLQEMFKRVAEYFTASRFTLHDGLRSYGE